MHIYLYIYKCMHIVNRECAPARTHAHAHVRNQKEVDACTNAYKHTYLPTYMHAYTRRYIYIVTHIVKARSRRVRAHARTHALTLADMHYTSACIRVYMRTRVHIRIHMSTLLPR